MTGMPVTDRIATVETFIIVIPRDVPYLGPLRPGESINARAIWSARATARIYPTTDRSVLVRITRRDGTVGWGETYGIVAPGAVTCDHRRPAGAGARSGAIRATPS